MNIPEKLKLGDEIRIIAPSRSASILSAEGIYQAKNTLEKMGFIVTFGKNIFNSDIHCSSSIEQRIEDIHAAFNDSLVKGILTAIGGFNSNDLLPHLNYDLIQKNPKVFCGYSDITAIATAIAKKAGFITYSGPHFSSFQMQQAQLYQKKYFKKCLMQHDQYIVEPSKLWSDDLWYKDQNNRSFKSTKWKIYNEGVGRGICFGGNLCTLNLLQGTEYMPNLRDTILFIEEDRMVIPETFARSLASLLQAAKSIKGLVIGRFQKKSKITEEHLIFILNKHPNLKEIPVIYDVDFGHTQPMFTFPIGGTVNVEILKQKKIKFLTF